LAHRLVPADVQMSYQVRARGDQAVRRTRRPERSRVRPAVRLIPTACIMPPVHRHTRRRQDHDCANFCQVAEL
jgi:hypothetical protein